MSSTNTKKVYIVSLCSYSYGVDDFIKTLPKLGKNVFWTSVNFDIYPGNLRRFDYFPTTFKDDDMVMFTDTSDVIFQRELPEIENKIYVSGELDYWGEKNWWKDKLEAHNFTELDGSEIYCMGTWMMPYKEVKDMLAFMKENEKRFNSTYYSDQILFNWWLKDKDYVDDKTLFGTLYSSLYKDKIKKENNQFFTDKGELISIIHANGNSKFYLLNNN